MLQDGELQPDGNRRTVILEAWENLTSPGPTLSSHERISVIRAAREAWAGGSDVPNRASIEDVGHWLAVDAGGFTADTVGTLETGGLDRFRYLEAVGVASRLAQVDFYARGLGASLLPVPDELDLPATGGVAVGAQLHDAWVPAIGNLSAVSVLDALPSDGLAFRALLEPFYVPFSQFMNTDYRDELHRTQIEYIAARTSYLNECFY